MKYQTVISKGMAWKVLSKNERTTVHAGRFFYAVRCRPGAYKIHEHDCDIAVTGSAKPLRVFDLKYQAFELSAAVREICGEITTPGTCVSCFAYMPAKAEQCPDCGQIQPPRHPSTEWDEHVAKMRAPPLPAYDDDQEGADCAA